MLGICSIGYSQEKFKPDRPLAIRWNTLGIFNLDGIGDLEYSISKRLGVFVGGGSEYVHPVFYPSHNWFKKVPDEVCKSTNWGIYAGVRISIPVWKFKGLALRPNVFFQHIDMQGACFGTPTNSPAITSYKSSEIGINLNIAYTQDFAGRFFIEPVIGIGPEIVTRDLVPAAHARYFDLLMPIQLNLGIRL